MKINPGLSRLDKFPVGFRTPVAIELPDRTDFMVPLTRIIPQDHFEPEAFPMRTIATAVAEETDMTIEALRGRRRSLRFARPRQLAMWLICKMCQGRSYPQIGKFFNRDHTTVIHAHRKIDELIFVDLELRALRDRVLTRLGVE